MDEEIVQSGYVEVWRGDEFVSRHSAQWKAVESALSHSKDKPSGEYEVRIPPLRIIVKRQIVAPEAPALGAAVATSATTVNVTLDRPATGPTTIDEYVLERTSTATWTEIARGIGIFVNNVYADSGLTQQTVYRYRLKAVDTTGRESGYSAEATVTTPSSSADITSPSVPTGLAGTQDGYAITLSWNASTDNVLVQNYDILRGPADGSGNATGSGAVIATTASTNYSDETVTSDLQYFYQVRARDTSGNLSAYSSAVFITAESTQQTYLFADGFEGESVGAALATTDWALNVDGGTISIANTTPLGTGGGNYFVGEIVKNATGTNFRAERRMTVLSGARPSYNGQPSLAYDMWYGFRWRPEECGGNVAGYPIQWHDDPGGDNTNPCLALRWNGSLLELLLSKVYTDAGALGGDWAGPIGTFALDDVIDLMFRVRWCYLPNALGGNGAVDVYVNDETTPRLSYRGSTAHAPPYTSGGVPFIKVGGYWSLYRYSLTNGVGVWTARNSYDQFRVQGVGGSRVGVKPQGSR